MLTIDVPLFRPKTVRSKADPLAGPFAAMFTSLIVTRDEIFDISFQKIFICFGRTPKILISPKLAIHMPGDKVPLTLSGKYSAFLDSFYLVVWLTN
jgi:hypothetical protein